MTIYLDHAASGPVSPEVIEAMRPFWAEQAANPAALHADGLRAAVALERARAVLAGALGAAPDEIVFVSGATEANNLALKGMLLGPGGPRGHLVVSAVEHPSVLESAHWLARLGVPLTIVPVDGQGFVDPDDVAAAIRADTALVSVQLANHEVGTVQDLSAIGCACALCGVPLHVDASQGFTLLPLPVELPALVTVSSHKIGGPKGAGALCVRAGTDLEPQLHGGGQERGLRAGTPNVAAIAGFAAAVDRARPEDGARIAALRDRLWTALAERVADLVLHGPRAPRLPGNLNLRVAALPGAALARALGRRGVSVSTGSACHAGVEAPSSVLLALGLDPHQALGAVRVSLGRASREDEVDAAALAFADAVAELRLEATP